MDFFKLSKMSRPSSTPVTMDAKLSSKRIMSAACLETSEPAIPIATPETSITTSVNVQNPSEYQSVTVQLLQNTLPT